MIIPVKCFTCGKVIGNLEGPMERLKEQGYDMNEICKLIKSEVIIWNAKDEKFCFLHL